MSSLSRVLALSSAASRQIPAAALASKQVFGPAARPSPCAPHTPSSTASSAESSHASVSLLHSSAALHRVVRYLNSDPNKTLAVAAPPPPSLASSGSSNDSGIPTRPSAAARRKARSRDMEHPYNAYNITVAIVGRPNVGKSTLFNKLCGRPAAIADGSAGVTRDWNDSPASLAGLEFRVIDTAGLAEVDDSLEHGDASRARGGFSIHNTPFGTPIKAEKRSGRGVGPAWKATPSAAANRPGKESDVRPRSSNYVLGRPLTADLQREILSLTEDAVAAADVIFFVVDARAGLNPNDEYFARWLRRLLTPANPVTAEEEADPTFNSAARSVLRRIATKPVVLVANKYDSDSDVLAAQLPAFYSLGLGDPVAISGTHNNGMPDLFTALSSAMGAVLGQWDAYQRGYDTRSALVAAGALSVEEVRKELAKRQWAITEHGYADPDVAAAEAAALLAPPAEEVAGGDEEESGGVSGGVRGAGKKGKPRVATLADLAASAAKDKAVAAAAAAQTAALAPMPGIKVLRRSADDDGSLQPTEALKPGVSTKGSALALAAAADAAGKGGVRLSAAAFLREHEEDYDNDDDDGDDGITDASWEVVREQEEAATDAATSTAETEPMKVRVVVAGKPNVGKSTLINALLGERRLLTGPQAGITRDSVSVDWSDARFPHHALEIVDTAGMRGVSEYSHSRFDRVDSIAMNSSVKALRRAHVLVLVIDIADGLYGVTAGADPVFAAQIRRNFVESIASNRQGASDKRARELKARQAEGSPLGRRTQAFVDALGSGKAADVRGKPEKGAYLDKLAMMVNRVAGAVSRDDIDIARVAAEDGKALIVIANKIDLLANGDTEVTAITKGLQALFLQQLAQNRGVTVLPMSAREGSSVDTLAEKVVQVYKYVF